MTLIFGVNSINGSSGGGGSEAVIDDTTTTTTTTWSSSKIDSEISTKSSVVIKRYTEVSE